MRFLAVLLTLALTLALTLPAFAQIRYSPTGFTAPFISTVTNQNKGPQPPVRPAYQKRPKPAWLP